MRSLHVFQGQLLWVGSLLALPLTKHPTAVDDRSAFLDLVSFQRNSTFHILLHSTTKKQRKKVSGGDWEVQFESVKRTPEFAARRLHHLIALMALLELCAGSH